LKWRHSAPFDCRRPPRRIVRTGISSRFASFQKRNIFRICRLNAEADGDRSARCTFKSGQLAAFAAVFSKAANWSHLPAVCRGRWQSSATPLLSKYAHGRTLPPYFKAVPWDYFAGLYAEADGDRPPRRYFQNVPTCTFCRRRHDLHEPRVRPRGVVDRHWKQTIIPMRAKSHRPKWSHHAGRQHQHRQLYRNRETDVAGRGGELNMRAGVRICILTVAWIVYET
jgi:hypothetical protein